MYIYVHPLLVVLTTMCARILCCARAGDGVVDEVDLMVDPDVPLQDQTVADKVRVVLQRAGHTNHTLLSLIQQNSPLASGRQGWPCCKSSPAAPPLSRSERYAREIERGPAPPPSSRARPPGAGTGLGTNMRMQKLTTWNRVDANAINHQLTFDHQAL